MFRYAGAGFRGGRRMRRRLAATVGALALALSGGAAAGACGGLPGQPEQVASAAVPADGAADAPADAADGPAAPPVDAMFHGLWTSYTDRERALVLDRYQAAGVRSVRIDVSWVMLQPDGRQSYDRWGTAQVDHVIEMANARKIRPLIMLWLTPAWANGDSGQRSVPYRPGDYARVAGWAAERWRGKVLGWEVWNEPNSPAFLHGADPVAYTRMLQAAYPAVKAGDPDAVVVFGGVEYNDVDWLRRAYDAGARGSFDVLATHPYQGVADLGPDARDGTKWTFTHAAEVRRLMVERGDGAKPIWFTEFGWSTHDGGGLVNWISGVDEDRQAAYLTAAARLVAAEMPYVQRMYWYSDRDTRDGDIQYANYGLFRRDLTAKPALAALAAVNAAAGQSRSAESDAPCLHRRRRAIVTEGIDW